MKLVTYARRGKVALGALSNGHVVDLSRAHRAAAATDRRMPTDLAALWRGSGMSLADARESLQYVEEQRSINRAPDCLYPVAEVEFLAPIQRPGKVVCVGLNYRSHLAEIGETVPGYPILFDKPSTSIVGHNQAVVLPRISRQVDYEGELAVVIGRRGKYIPEKDALSYVAGYTCANDISAHDIEFRTSQWTSGKMLDTFCPLGPVLLTADEVLDPDQLHLKTTLNGRTVQDECTSDMVFSVRFLISYISSLATLEPGDIILTGTPAGIGCNQRPQVFLRGGDRLGVEIQGIGILANPVIEEEGR
jgi:acylpyruvate hydrolase